MLASNRLLSKRAGLMQLANDGDLVKVVSLQAKALHLISRSSLIHRLLVGADGLESLSKKRFAGLGHSDYRPFHF
ncbi:hypothetical protein A0O30_08480 [Pseudomonas sp. LLC-1]|nr:hypothetical protein A0O30_08480 [Pseudomonas sp. LLC-1]